MARPLRIVIVSYVDDNFGDNLIRISFEALLHVAFAQHGVGRDDYRVLPMSLKHVDEELLADADAVFFAGGGLFGTSYLGFFEHVDRITEIADRRGIPVVFSSMGLNNMDARDGSVDAIVQIVRRRSVRALSVRENLPLFQEIAADLPFEVQQVADPATWTKYVYGMTDTAADGTMGINVVRGGLFAANGQKWGLTAEMEYLAGLREMADRAGVVAQFYTNGSLDDNNTLRFFAREYGLPNEQIILPQTTREVVEAIASRSSIASIRMHSSIIAYSFGIPTIALEWNDKVPYFYEAIGHRERVIPFGEWTPSRAFETLVAAGGAPEPDPGYRDFLMSTYHYLQDALGSHVLNSTSAAYGFDDVAGALAARAHLIDEDEFDLRVKMGKVERAYLGRFISIREKDNRLRSLTREVDTLATEIGELRTQLHAQKRELEMRFTTRLARFIRKTWKSLVAHRR